MSAGPGAERQVGGLLGPNVERELNATFGKELPQGRYLDSFELMLPAKGSHAGSFLGRRLR